MAEMRVYKVIAVPPNEGAEAQKYIDLGEHEADRAERAVEAAVACAGNGVVIGRCVAVPLGNWAECIVEEDPRPRFKAKRVQAEPEPAA